MANVLPVLLVTAALLVSSGTARDAEANHEDWLFGAGFRIGGFAFHVASPAYWHSGAPYDDRDYFFRTFHRIRYRGYACSAFCFRQQRHVYHPASCPLVSHHFRRYGYTTHAVNARYGPRPFPPRGRARGWRR